MAPGFMYVDSVITTHWIENGDSPVISAWTGWLERRNFDPVDYVRQSNYSDPTKIDPTKILQEHNRNDIFSELPVQSVR